MTAGAMKSEDDVALALRSHVRKGQGLTRPYARKWDMAGFSPVGPLALDPAGGLQTFAGGLAALSDELTVEGNSIRVGSGPTSMWVAVNRSSRGEGPPDAYLVGHDKDCSGYTGSAGEVVLEILRSRETPCDTLSDVNLDQMQVGFPGSTSSELTYVGSWQWNIHAEARGEEFLCRAVTATTAVIRSRREQSDG